MVVKFVRIKFSWILLSFLSMIIYEALSVVFKVEFLQRLVLDTYMDFSSAVN